MCGIVGYIGNGQAPLLRRMTDILSHRGPDDSGTFIEGNVGLGHRRLSIIDLSRAGRQPMADRDGRAVITYNGEIYNFAEIKKELSSLGYTFSSRTDTEVLLYAYMEWGEDCLRRLNGMFAFAIWDKREKTLFLARDRLGIKPLYYVRCPDGFVFGSEIKALLLWPGLTRKVNLRALDYFMTFRYNPLEETMFQGVQKLPPGHFMKVRPRGNGGDMDVTVRQYWQPKPNGGVSQNELEAELDRQLHSSLKYRLISDVPVGVLLSAGVDSSTIVGLLKKKFDKTPQTFTVGFDTPGFEDELDPVRFTTSHFGTDHTEYICRPEVTSVLPRVIWHADEPNADPACLPTYLISEEASRKVKVLLSGEGSDELYGGYERMVLFHYAWKTSSLAPGALRLLPAVVGFIPNRILDSVFKYTSAIGQPGLERLNRFCRHFPDVSRSYLEVANITGESEKTRMYGPDLLARLKEEDIAETLSRDIGVEDIKDADSLFYALSRYELRTRLPNDLLAKIDTMTMAHSVEGRVPYLDHNTVEFALGVPVSEKIRWGRDKRILRKVAEQWLPETITRRKKDHFFVPIHLWLQNELRPLMESCLDSDRFAGMQYFNPDTVRQLYSEYISGNLVHARQLWCVLNFVIWHKLFIESDLFAQVDPTNLTLQDLAGDIGLGSSSGLGATA